MKEQSYYKVEARFGLSIPKKTSHILLLDHINGFEFFWGFFWVPILCYLPLLLEGKPGEFWALSAVVIIGPG